MDYQIIVVEDDELPAGTGWVIARQAERVTLIMTRTRCAQGGMGDVWLAWMRCGGFDAPLATAV